MSGDGGHSHSQQARCRTLLAVAARAGDRRRTTARAEGAVAAAAVAESAPGAPADWARLAQARAPQDFFDAAVRGRRWRGAPTAVLSDLVARGLGREGRVRRGAGRGGIGRLHARRADDAGHRQRLGRRGRPAPGRRRPAAHQVGTRADRPPPQPAAQTRG